MSWPALSVVVAACAVGLTVAGIYLRLTFMENRRRIERLERQHDELPDIYARKDDTVRGLNEIRQNFAEVFEQLRRANEGIAALRGKEE